MERTGKMALKQLSHDFLTNPPVMAQDLINRFRESTFNSVLSQLGLWGVPTERPCREYTLIWDLPESVMLKSPEGILRMNRLPRRPKLLEQALERLLEIPELSKTRLAPAKSGEGQ